MSVVGRTAVGVVVGGCVGDVGGGVGKRWRWCRWC